MGLHVVMNIYSKNCVVRFGDDCWDSKLLTVLINVMMYVVINIAMTVVMNVGITIVINVFITVMMNVLVTVVMNVLITMVMNVLVIVVMDGWITVVMNVLNVGMYVWHTDPWLSQGAWWSAYHFMYFC